MADKEKIAEIAPPREQRNENDPIT